MLFQGQVGAQQLADGSNPAIRQGKQGDVSVSELHSVYYEQNYRGNIFTAFVNAVTLASTHASPLAAGTGTPIIGILNTVNSNKNLVIIKTVITTTSGTPGGPFLWNTIANGQNISAGSSTATNNYGFASVGSNAKLWNNTAITGSTLGVAFRVIGGPAAIAAGAGIYTVTDESKGDLIIPPGGMLGLACTAAGTTHIISAYVTWEEVPV